MVDTSHEPQYNNEVLNSVGWFGVCFILVKIVYYFCLYSSPFFSENKYNYYIIISVYLFFMLLLLKQALQSVNHHMLMQILLYIANTLFNIILDQIKSKFIAKHQCYACYDSI